MHVSSLIENYQLNGIVHTFKHVVVYNAIGRSMNRMYNIAKIAKSGNKNPFSSLLTLKSEYLVSCVDVFEDAASYYAAFELPIGNPISDIIKVGTRIKEDRIAYILNQIIQAVKYIHKSGLGYIRISPSTIFITASDNIMIADYSFIGNITPSGRITSRPEIFENTPPEFFKSGCFVASQADVWSIGIFAYNLLTGCHPFKNNTQSFNQSEYLIQESIMKPITIPNHISTSAHNFLQRTLEIEPTRRYSVDQCLSHLWIAKQAKKIIKVSQFNSFNSLQFEEMNILKSNGLSTLSSSKNSPLRFSNSTSLSNLQVYSSFRAPSEFEF